MIKIEIADLSQSETVFDLVEKLLYELREESEDLSTIDREHVRADWLKNSDRFTVFIARAEDKTPVGVLTLDECFAIYAGGNYGIINELYISPEYRSRKIGRRLLDAVKEHARTRGWKRVDVTAPAGDQWARTVCFYEREGFIFTGPKLKYFIG